LVVLGAEPDAEGRHWWRFIRWIGGGDGFWEHDEFWPAAEDADLLRDTGQDANEVLAAWLEASRA